MNIEQIHFAFSEVVNTRGIYNVLGVPKNNVAQYRWKLKRNIHITLDKKLYVLQKAGYRVEQFQYTDAHLLDIVKFTIKAAQNTRDMGAEYVLDKWKLVQENKRG